MNKRNTDRSSSQGEQWLDEVLGQVEHRDEIGMDEHAVQSAGLRHPDELDLENIMAEDWDKAARQMTEEESQPELKPAPEVPAEDYSDEDEDDDEDDYSEVEAVSYDGKGRPIEKKRRPKMKKGYGLLGIPHILATAIWLVLIAAIGISLGRVIWVCCADLMAFDKEDRQVTVTVTDTDDIQSVAQKLSKAGLIRYPGLFQKFAELTGKDERISVGTFTLNAQLDYNAMINAMGSHAPAREDVDILFPEGYNCAQIFRLLEKNGVCTVEELEQYAAEGELDDYWFLEGVERGSKYCLEGYLAPDTYTFYINDDPERVLEKFLDEFDDRFTDIMHQNYETLKERYASMLSSHGFDQAYIDANPLTLHKVLTVASMVQKEMADDREVYDIASVFYNRITDPRNYPHLDSDATVYYAIGDYFGDVMELTEEHLNIVSPYNTRKQEGLPPGPICNPGFYALYGALDPNETNYHYFVYDSGARVHRFSNTYSEHQRIVEELGL